MRRKYRHSLTFKLTRWYVLFILIALVMAGFLLHRGLKDRLLDDIDETVLEIADETYEMWRRKRGVTWKDAIQTAEERFSQFEPLIQYVELEYRGEKKIKNIVRSEKIPEGTFLFSINCYYRADRSDIDDLVFYTLDENNLGRHPVRTILFPVRGPNILQVGISLQDAYSDLNRMLVLMILIGGLFLVLASVGGGIIINRALRPVKKVVRTAKKISAENLSLRIDAKNRGDEIGELVETFNDMIVRLESAVEKIRQFSGDVSHELRTPLTIIRGEVEVVLRKNRKRLDYVTTLMSVLEESRRMEKIIDNLLFLSRTEGLDPSALEQTVRLDEVAAEAVDSLKRTAEERKLRLETKQIETVSVKGNPELLERMVINILDNALRYTPEGGRVSVSVRKKKGTAVLSVSDTGIGIAEEDLPKIFDRLYVADLSRSRETGGSGLGLSIVKWIADSHGAAIKVDSVPGRGTAFTVEF